MDINTTLAEIHALHDKAAAEYTEAVLRLAVLKPGTSAYEEALVNVIDTALSLGEIRGYLAVVSIMQERDAMLN